MSFLNHRMSGGSWPGRTVLEMEQESERRLPACTKRSLLPGITAWDSAGEERGRELTKR